MIIIVPFVYLFGCLLAGVIISAVRRISLLKAVILCVLFTPLLGSIISVYLKARPRAYCMYNYLHFEVGRPYPYKSVLTNKNEEEIWVYSDQVYKLKPKTFNKYFSKVVDKHEQVSNQRSFKSL